MEDPAATQRLAHLVALNAEIESLKSQLESEQRKMYAALRVHGDMRLRVELLCTCIKQLCDLAECGVDRATDTAGAQALVDNARELATELLK